MLVTGPAIGRLFARPRIWAYRQVRAGRFGPIIKCRGRAFFVDIRNVEARIGYRFSASQLAAAGLQPAPDQEAA